MTREEALEQALKRSGLKLPPPPKPVGAYQTVIFQDNFAFLSGQISKDQEGRMMTGKVGQELTLEEGKRAAQLAALQALSLISSEIDLERVQRIVRLVGFVQSASDFYAQSEVVNAASELFLEIFGEAGRHARTSVGVASLPLNAAVELELTLKLQ